LNSIVRPEEEEEEEEEELWVSSQGDM
jgi:hypothetical protein